MCAMPFVRVIDLYQHQVQWLLQDSRKVTLTLWYIFRMELDMLLKNKLTFKYY